jgi:hypothetical protein
VSLETAMLSCSILFNNDYSATQNLCQVPTGGKLKYCSTTPIAGEDLGHASVGARTLLAVDLRADSQHWLCIRTIPLSFMYVIHSYIEPIYMSVWGLIHVCVGLKNRNGKIGTNITEKLFVH